jgi:ribosome-associated protein
MDYMDFVVHVFTPKAREFYDLERLWRGARRLEVPPPIGAGSLGSKAK